MLYCPPGHDVQLVEPAGAYWPALHCPPQLAVVAPALPPEYPAAQGRQNDDPGTSMYCPAGHALQPLSPASVYCPALHTPEQLADFNPVVLPYSPAAQGMQNDDPGTSMYCPAAHEVHALEPDSEYCPAMHVPLQFADFKAVVLPYKPAAQAVHVVLPVTAAYWPVLQLLQLFEPVFDAYWPSAHAVHAPEELDNA